MSTHNQSIVTVVVVPRESFNMFREVAERIYAVTSPIFNMLIMEGHAPSNRRKELEDFASKHSNCKIVYSNRWKYPHEMVNDALPLIDTKYAVFIDNDVEVLEDWLENLVRTAEEKKAHCVHPIYLTVKLTDPSRKIHIAEGKFYREQRGDKWFIDTIACYSGVSLKDYPDRDAKESDFFEWHTVMFTKELLEKIGPLDDLNVAEHLDYALRIHQAGYKIWLEPKAVVAYDYGRIWELRGVDREYLIWRWDVNKAAKSHERVCQKWNLDPECTLRRQYFVKEHTAKMKTMRPMSRIINKIRRTIGLGNMPLNIGPKPQTVSQKAQEELLASIQRSK